MTNPNYILSSLYVGPEGVGSGVGIGAGVGLGSGVGTGIVPLEVSFEGMVSFIGGTGGAVSFNYLFPR